MSIEDKTFSVFIFEASEGSLKPLLKMTISGWHSWKRRSYNLQNMIAVFAQQYYNEYS